MDISIGNLKVVGELIDINKIEVRNATPEDIEKVFSTIKSKGKVSSGIYYDAHGNPYYAWE